MILHSILIKNGRIWDGREFFTGNVFIRDGKIVSVGDAADPAELVFDAAGRLVTPGLVDIHTHMRHISNERFGTLIETVCFTNGVTAAVDAGGDGPGDERLLDHSAVDALVFVSVPIRENRPDFTETGETLARFGRRAIGLKVYFDSAGGQVLDTSPLREVCEYAHRRSLRVMVHTNGSPTPMKGILEVLSEGDICTHAFHGGANSALEDHFASLRAAQQRGVVIDGGFAGTVHLDTEVLRSALQSGLVPDTVSTDITKMSAFARGGNYGLDLCMTVARALGMPEEEILRSVTYRAAKAVGQEDSWGLLVPGRRGDLAVLDFGACPYEFRNADGSFLTGEEGYRCVLTVSAGEVVYRSHDI